jgi:hypothetical protein
MTNINPTAGLNTGSVLNTGLDGTTPVNNTMQKGQRVFGSTDSIFGN